MMIFAISLSIGFGLQKVPMAVQHIEGTLNLLLTSGLLPVAVIAVLLTLLLPEESN
jgi:NCS2 family nucleobase:cation symporter-2